MIRLALSLILIATPALSAQTLRWRLWIGDDQTKYVFNTEERCLQMAGRDPDLICRTEMFDVCNSPGRYDAMRDGVDCFDPPRDK
jgi:hypothetical protein